MENGLDTIYVKLIKSVILLFICSSAAPYAELQITRPTKNRKDFTVSTHKLEGDVKGKQNPNWGDGLMFCIENVEKAELNNISVEININDHRVMG